MDLQFYGANCVGLNVKGTRIVIDDNLADLGAKTVTKAGDVALFTGPHGLPAKDVRLTFDSPGEYEVADVSVIGIPARAHLDEGGLATTMYKIVHSELTVLITGHIYPELTEKQLERIGIIDVMIVPVGGSGYTLDPVGALKVVKAVEPKLVIPTHYADKALNYPVPQIELASALHDLAMEPKETVSKMRVKAAELGAVMQLVVLEKS